MVFCPWVSTKEKQTNCFTVLDDVAAIVQMTAIGSAEFAKRSRPSGPHIPLGPFHLCGLDVYPNFYAFQ